jgi:hypothetical protein
MSQRSSHTHCQVAQADPQGKALSKSLQSQRKEKLNKKNLPPFRK